MRKFAYKGYGRIYCKNQEDIRYIKDIIEEMDAFEYDYLPENLITVFTDFPKTVFIGKFNELDLDLLTAISWSRGINMWVLDNGMEMFASRKYSLIGKENG